MKAEHGCLDPADLLTPQQLAERLHVHLSWVYEMTRDRWKIRNGGKDPLPCHRMGGLLRFVWSEVSEWLLKQ